METNEAERRRWNDEQWAAAWPKRERLTDEVTPYVLDALALRPGERVLDIGCGGGGTTLAASAAVGREGAVVGADISVPITNTAKQRAREAGADNVTFVVVDMQGAAVAGGPFDAAMSQFGVMFFDEPVTAFSNIAAHLKPGGRFVFACWRTLAENPWHFITVLAPFAPPPAPGPGKSPTGPFALGDHERTVGILDAAGFVDVQRTTYELTVETSSDSLVDDVQLAMMGITGDALTAAKAAVAEHLDRFRVADQGLWISLAFQIFAATRP